MIKVKKPELWPRFKETCRNLFDTIPQKGLQGELLIKRGWVKKGSRWVSPYSKQTYGTQKAVCVERRRESKRLKQLFHQMVDGATQSNEVYDEQARRGQIVRNITQTIQQHVLNFAKTKEQRYLDKIDRCYKKLQSLPPLYSDSKNWRHKARRDNKGIHKKDLDIGE